MDSTAAGLLGAVIGGILTAVPTIVTFLANLKEQRRRHIQKLALKTALDNWRCQFELVQKGAGKMRPYQIYVIASLKLMEIARIDRIDKESALKCMREFSQIINALDTENETQERKESSHKIS